MGQIYLVNNFSLEVKEALADFIICFSQLEHMVKVVCKRFQVQIDSTGLDEILHKYRRDRKELKDKLRRLVDISSPVPELATVKVDVAEMIDQYALLSDFRHVVCHGVWGEVEGTSFLLDEGNVLPLTAERLSQHAKECYSLALRLNQKTMQNSIALASMASAGSMRVPATLSSK